MKIASLALIAGLLACTPAPAAEDPAPPKPPVAKPGDDPAPSPEGDAPTAPPGNIEQAYKRLNALRELQLGGPGSVPRRLARFKRLADQTMTIHAATPATGEDVYRVAEILLDAERFEEAATFATRYLDGAGKTFPPSLGYAHAVRVRSLSRLGKLTDAEAAMKAYREALPKADGIGPVTKLLGDALVEGGRLEDGLVRYKESVDLLAKPISAAGVGTWQAMAEVLVALDRVGEARKGVEGALRETSDPGSQERLRAVLARIGLAGKPFAPLPFDRWLQGAAPESGSTKGKVVVWYVFAWWMDSRAATLDDWRKRVAEAGDKGLVVLPVTRTGGWDPAARKFDDKRPPDAEAADILKSLKDRGWTLPFALYLGEPGFKALEVRGLPFEIVVGRDGNVRMATAGSESGHSLALRAAAAALLEAPPPPVPPR